MRIGIDVDGVLVDTEAFLLRDGKKYFEKKYGISIKNPAAFEVQEMFGCTSMQREAFWRRYIWKYCLQEPMRKDAATISAELKKDGHEIIIITSRVHTTEQGIMGAIFRSMLRYWLQKNYFVYDDIAFCRDEESAIDKRTVCEEKQINVLIDDTPENLYAIQDKVRPICYSAVWNTESHDLDDCRAENFQEVYELIRK